MNWERDFLESVYKNALRIALQQKGFGVATEFPLQVTFRGEIIGKYYADMIVEDKIIIELKTVEQLRPDHSAQVINYLKATGIEVGLLINFGMPRIQYKRLENIKDQS